MCNFPAKQLIEYRRQAAQRADRETNPKRQRALVREVFLIEQLRLEHADTGCKCYMEAE